MGSAGPLDEFDRDFKFQVEGLARDQNSCQNVNNDQFIKFHASKFLSKAIDEDHMLNTKKDLWCSWDRVENKCVHSGRFCYLLDSESLCKTFCPKFKWHNWTDIDENNGYFGHLFHNSTQAIENLKFVQHGICNGTT